METLKPALQEGRRIFITAFCKNCSWRSTLPTTTIRLAADAGLLQDTAKQHEEKHNHLVKFKVG